MNYRFIFNEKFYDFDWIPQFIGLVVITFPFVFINMGILYYNGDTYLAKSLFIFALASPTSIFIAGVILTVLFADPILNE